MTTIRQELLRLIVLNHAEKWVPHHIAFQQLDGDGLIHGLTECLGDDDAEVRLLAVNLLDEACERAKPALPLLIEKLKDEDRLVRISAAHSLAKFGTLAVDAVQYLMPWLQDENEYMQIVAATTVLKLDPTKSVELQSHIEAAKTSSNPMVRFLVEELDGA